MVTTDGVTTQGVLASPPQGKTYLIKDVRAHNHNANAVVFDIVLTRPQVPWHLSLLPATLDPDQARSVSGWIVMAPADIMFYRCDWPNVTIWISGTVLEGVADIPVLRKIEQLPANRPAIEPLEERPPA